VVEGERQGKKCHKDTECVFEYLAFAWFGISDTKLLLVRETCVHDTSNITTVISCFKYHGFKLKCKQLCPTKRHAGLSTD
jgi:hypothetical protein